MGVDSWNPLIYHIEKVYHTPQDNVFENISPERMKMALDVIGTGVYNTLQKPVTQTEQKAHNREMITSHTKERASYKALSFVSQLLLQIHLSPLNHLY